MVGLSSMRKLTTLLFIFQAVVVVFFMLLYNQNAKSKYDNYKKIAVLLESPEFDVKKELLEQQKRDQAERDADAKKDNDDLREVETDNDETDKDDTDKDENELEEKTSESILALTDNKTTDNPEDSDNFGDDTDIPRTNNSLGGDFETKQEEGTETSEMEQSFTQFSGMKDLKKEISANIKNPEGRFISDKRILYSEVYEQVETLKDIKLLVIVSSSAKKRQRRDAIRASWWSECESNKVKCLFFTDDINSPKLTEIKPQLLHESRVYKDMIFQPIDVGVKFGLRFLFQFQWAVANYRFQYILRVDDDVMICLHRLLHDLDHFPKNNMQWGFLHCTNPGAVFIDEGITMFTRDLVLKFLSQNPHKMRCHLYGDQEIAMWIQDLNLDATKIYFHDDRIHHSPAANQMRTYFNELEDICAKHIAVHGTYPEELEEFWAKKRTREYPIVKKPDDTDQQCHLDYDYQWNVFKPEYKYPPKYCHKKPTWVNILLESNDGQFEGREERPENDELWSKMQFVD
eukprot:gene8089-8956_t